MCKCLFLIGWAGFLRQGLFRRRFFSWPHNKMQGSRCSQGVLRNSCSDSFNKRKLKKTFGKCFRKYSFFNFFWKTLRNNGNLQITRPQFLKRPNSWIYREFQNSFFLAHPRVVFLAAILYAIKVSLVKYWASQYDYVSPHSDHINVC